MSFFQNIFRKKSITDALAHAESESAHGGGLQKNLRVLDLTALGIAAIIGAGIFSTIGTASSNGGPAVVFLFLFTAIACGFSALCYAQFASVLPISGSAYTYTYTTFGELLAWIVGWNLLWEYAIGNVVVAISWSDYFTGLLNGIGVHIPDWMTIDWTSASKSVGQIAALTSEGKTIADASQFVQIANNAWQTAPQIGGIRMIFDFPALIIIFSITALVYRGIQESKNVSNMLVLFKLLVIFAVIAVGAFYVQPSNWSPFAPNGVKGVLSGVSAVFFAYIGFDAISTTAEECKDPQKDLPRSMFLSLLICTILYVIISLVLTGMVPFSSLAVGDPLAFVFKEVGLDFFSGVVALSAVVATASVFLVFQLGQPRIWMSMSRDGLLPKKFSEIHPKYRTPAFSTILTGIVVAVPSLFMNLNELADLTSLGTLFAFAIVCAGVLQMDANGTSATAKYKVKYFNSRYWLPVLLLATYAIIKMSSPEFPQSALACKTPNCEDQWLFYAFLAILVITTVLSVIYSWSLIPVVGLLLNLFMMSQVTLLSWERFGIWMLIGLAIYLAYGYRNSKIHQKA
jgi:basic amino acid/polyamine antiporter, APA family